MLDLSKSLYSFKEKGGRFASLFLGAQPALADWVKKNIHRCHENLLPLA